MITLYGTLRSRATRVIWAAEETGLPYTREKVAFAASLPDPLAADAPMNTASKAFLAINPMGQLPAMKDGDLCMGESLAICLYLARKAGAPVGPATLAEEGEILQWAMFAASVIEPPAVEILYANMQGKVGTPEGDGIVSGALAKLQRPLARLESHLAGTDWLVAGRFTVADILMEETLRYATVIPGVLDAFPRTKAWFDTCRARPAYQKMWAMRDAE
jgi:glutathione S-transferase